MNTLSSDECCVCGSNQLVAIPDSGEIVCGRCGIVISDKTEEKGPRFPNIVLELCDSCRWCASCFNTRGLTMKCPICSTENSEIPMNIDEVCYMEFSNIRGITLSFDRKNPMR